MTGRLYTDLAAWWPLLSAPVDYVEEAAFYRQMPEDVSGYSAQTLELGSGGGNRVAPQGPLRDGARGPRTGHAGGQPGLNPECEHIQGDMRTVRLDRQFDAVFVHDAIAYMTSEADLRRAIETAWVHCKPGGAALFAPDHLRETFQPSTDHGGHDGPDRGLR